METVQAGFELEALAYDEVAATHRGAFDPEAPRANMAVVSTLAAVEEVDPGEVEPLDGSGDLDALDAVVSSGIADPGDITATLPVDGHSITVGSDGRVTCTSSSTNTDDATDGEGDVW